jgi:small subunit ribosomal protein S1
MGAKGPDIKWEDDDGAFGQEGEEPASGGEFEELLGRAAPRAPSLMIGEKVKGVVSLIPPAGGDVLVDLGGKSSGIIEKQELLDETGQLKVKVGDPVEAFVLSKKAGEILLSYRMSQQLKSIEDLAAAKERGLSVRGRVLKVVKGGYEVAVLGKTAFCPLSQIDTRFSETGAEHLNKEYEFLVERVDERGRNIVLTRAPLLRAQAEAKAKELLANLSPDQVLSGTVTEVRDFGAFVDLGGVEGLVHVSQLSHARVARPADVVGKGDKVRVKVLKVEKDERGRPKISLSMKAASQDPWETLDEQVKTGESYTGRVVNLMPFGAFVEVRPGIEGLLHVSEMSWTKRVHHPSEVVKVGDAVTVTVKEIDRVQKRLSLSMKQVEDDPWFGATARFPVGKVVKAPVERLKPFGAIVELAAGLTGLLPLAALKRQYGEAYRQPCSPGKELEVRIVALDTEARKVLLSLAAVEEEESDRKHYLEYLAAEKQAAAAEAARAAAAGAAGKDGQKTGSFGALLSAKLSQRQG